MKKGNEKRDKGLKNASFWAIKSKKNSPCNPPAVGRGYALTAANLFVVEKKWNLKRGGGGMIRMHNIYPCTFLKT